MVTQVHGRRIDCVAVTDHNTGEWIDLLKAAYAQMKREADAGAPPDGFRRVALYSPVWRSRCKVAFIC